MRLARAERVTNRIPPHAYFVVSAVFHYLGPALAVLLFARIGPPGVAWLRIMVAALVFAAWRRPWRTLPELPARQRWLLLWLGLTLAAMNTVFYLAIARLPLATVGGIEFLGPIVLAVVGLRGVRNLMALVLAVGGVALLTDMRIVDDPVGVALAFANCALFVAYVVLGKRIAADGAGAGVDRLGIAMLIAAVVALPIGIADAVPSFTQPPLLAAALAVGVCSSVIPYVCDQFALARLSQSAFALLLALLPATATVIGIVVLAQVPSLAELAGIALIVAGVAIHRDRASAPPSEGEK